MSESPHEKNVSPPHPRQKTETNYGTTRYVLAIDLGSGGLKVAVVADKRGLRIFNAFFVLNLER
jgi:hypothetical protein